MQYARRKTLAETSLPFFHRLCQFCHHQLSYLGSSLKSTSPAFKSRLAQLLMQRRAHHMDSVHVLRALIREQTRHALQLVVPDADLGQIHNTGERTRKDLKIVIPGADLGRIHIYDTMASWAKFKGTGRIEWWRDDGLPGEIPPLKIEKKENMTAIGAAEGQRSQITPRRSTALPKIMVTPRSPSETTISPSTLFTPSPTSSGFYRTTAQTTPASTFASSARSRPRPESIEDLSSPSNPGSSRANA